MAIDTRNKRASAISAGIPFIVIAPRADGTIDASDRQTVAGVYSGIVIDAPIILSGETENNIGNMTYPIQVSDTKIDITLITNTVAIYNITVDVIRNSISVGALGNTPTPSTIVNDMLCMIKWTSGKEKMLFNKNTHFLNAVLRCRVPPGVTIVVSDIVEYDSIQYEIVDVIDFRNLGKLLVIGLRKVT